MSDEAARLLRLATYSSVATALLLIAAKLVAWLATGSVSVMASLVDSLMDAGASLVNLLAVRYALMPADDEHRFGHGKAESLAGLGQATFIAGSALFLILQAVDRLRFPRPLEDPAIGIALYILYSAWGIGSEAVHQLMDRELGAQVQARVRALVTAHPQVLGVHGLRTRQSGRNEVIQLHVELDGALPLSEAHAITDDLERELLEAFPNADVIIHQEPHAPT